MDSRETKRKGRRQIGLMICFLAYVTAGVMAWLVYDAISIFHPMLVVLILDILATLVIFLFSLMFNNSSLYDPYWSLAPPLIMLYWVFNEQTLEATTLLQIIILSTVIFWSLRLTLNWLTRWRGIRDEDWRYIAFRFKYQENYWIVSLTGIHLFPTLIVLLGCLSVYPALVLHEGSMGLMEWIATVVIISGVLIETIADVQLRGFNRDESKCDFQDTGLWRYSRHPNYFGEILFWVGLFLFSTGMEEFYWWILPGPILMILMFYTISIPMIDRRMLRRRTGYRDYLKRTSALIPLPPGKQTGSSVTILKE
jgi:steroid 5-alpha reductase family enzyme